MSINVLKLNGSITDSRFPTMGKFIDPTPVMPVTDSLAGLYVFNNRADWLKNFANPALPATLLGSSPARTSQYADFRKESAIDLGFQVDPAWSCIVVERMNDQASGSGVTISNYMLDASGSTGDTIATNASGSASGPVRTYAARVAVSDGVIGVVSADVGTSPGLTGMEIFGSVFATNDTGNQIFYRKNSDGSVVKVPIVMNSTITRNPNSMPRNLRVGNIYGTSTAWTGSSKIALMAVYKKTLTDTELRQCSDYLANVWCKDMGIVLHGA